MGESRTTTKPPQSRGLPAMVIGLTLGIFAVAILLISLNLRATIQQQILGRDSDVLNALALMQQHSLAAIDELGSLIEEPAQQLALALESSQSKEVLAVRLYDDHGRFVTALPLDVVEADLNAQDWPQLKALRPVSRFQARARLSDLFLLVPEEKSGRSPPVPLLEVVIPISPADQAHLVGVAQFIIDGHRVQREFATLDHNLWRHGLAVFLIGGAAVSGSLGWAFRRLQQANRLLTERTHRLLQANQELALQAKTSAVGTLAAHLLHGLKNPLSGLQQAVTNRGPGNGVSQDISWEDVAATTRRMQNLVNETVRILREEDGLSQYELTVDELVDLIAARLEPAARQAGVLWTTQVNAVGRLQNRQANLVLVILENLLHNAIQATPPGKSVLLRVARAPQGLAFEVRDEGSGVPPETQPCLFTPCRSTKPGGNGIGLALCKQLAHHLSAELVLKSTSRDGSVFALVLPLGSVDPDVNSLAIHPRKAP